MVEEPRATGAFDDPANKGPQAVTPSTGAMPQYSPDGRFWWNGQAWQPVAPVVQYSVVPAAGKSKTAAALLGILLGDFGIHKFYLGQVGLGIVYLLFCWTLIPGLIGLIEGIVYLTTNDVEWARRYPPVIYPMRNA